MKSRKESVKEKKMILLKDGLEIYTEFSIKEMKKAENT